MRIVSIAVLKWLLLFCLLDDICAYDPAGHKLEARQSSDGCGPNPLVALVSYAREFGDFSPQQLVRFIETDRSAWGQLRSLLRTYDDCVRTGDGTRYKRPSSLIAKLQLFNQSSPLGLKVTRSFSQDNQTWKNILQTLVENHQMKPDVY